MIDPRSVEADFNAQSRDQWEGFADHRRAVSRCLLEGSTPGLGRLCVLGAGNANDLDLPALLAAYREVHLVDLDARALAGGATRQGVAGHPGLRLLGGLDVTGMVEALARWSPATSVDDRELAALAGWPMGRVAAGIGERFDVVASTCLLSQLVGHAGRALGERHPRLAEAVRAIRRGHLRLLVGLARGGGTAWLITDLISSDRHPGLADLTPEDLPGLVADLARRGGLIRGVNPAGILAAFRRDPALAASSVGIEAFPPWLWRLHRRHYLVWALRCRIGRETPGIRGGFGGRAGGGPGGSFRF